MKQHSEFVIIGGGVLGASLAYQLSLHGREVLLLEQNEICSGTSSGTVAWIGPFDRQPLFMEELAIRSFLRLFLLEHELDRPFEFTVTGSLKPLYTEKDIAAAQKAAEMGAAAGYDVVRILAPEDAHRGGGAGLHPGEQCAGGVEALELAAQGGQRLGQGLDGEGG